MKSNEYSLNPFFKYSPLHVAAIFNDSNDIDTYTDVNCLAFNGITPLHLAAQTEGSVDALKALIERGANLNQKDNYGETALHCAAYEACVEQFKVLLEKGANIYERNGYFNKLPIDAAIKNMNKTEDNEKIQRYREIIKIANEYMKKYPEKSAETKLQNASSELLSHFDLLNEENLSTEDKSKLSQTIGNFNILANQVIKERSETSKTTPTTFYNHKQTLANNENNSTPAIPSQDSPSSPYPH